MDGHLLVRLDFVWQNFLNRLGFNNCILMMFKFLFVSWMFISNGFFPMQLNASQDYLFEDTIFSDMHAHPSRFHRDNVDSISFKEIELYKSQNIDLVVAAISTDMAFHGNYETTQGLVPKGEYKPLPGDSFKLTVERLERLKKTSNEKRAILALSPSDVLSAKSDGYLSIISAIEGADGLEGNIQNLYTFYEMGLRLIQLVHFRANKLGHVQSYPYSPGGLTKFGKEVVLEANKLNMIIDIAHANTETILDVLEFSKDPVIFSHGGLKSLKDQDRALTDQEVILIAQSGGIVGIWPHGKYIESVSIMVDYIEHVINLVGPEHVGIASDLRGISKYSEGFGSEANFHSIIEEMTLRGHDKSTIGNVMGGNFFRLWQKVAD